jgi:tyrosyl-tRNA synthetase
MAATATPDSAATDRANIVSVLEERGLIQQITESGLAEAAAREQLYVYCGFDPSRPSLQVGNLVPVMILGHFQRQGHRPIVVVGGGTGMIGDPSGKSAERVLLSTDEVAANAAHVREQLSHYVSFEGENAAVMVNNMDWLGQMTLIEYLRDIGKHLTVNFMLAKDSVKTRLGSETGISYTEFSYMMLQATDFLHLYDAFGCTVQVGGNDQWGNLTAGVELIRKARGAQAHALTAPLVTTSTGQKLGKTEGNALYLDPQMTSPYTMYQYWFNTADEDVARFLRVFTFLPLDEIAAIERDHLADPARRAGQKRLAFEIVALIHGEATAKAVAAASRVLFGGGSDELTPDVLPHLAAEVPTLPVTASALAAGIPVVEALVNSGLQPSKGAARRLIQQGGVYLNDQRSADTERLLTPTDAVAGGRAILLRAGKNKYALLLLEG